MTKEKAKEIANILLAYSEGKTIQKNFYAGWVDVENLNGEDLKQATSEIKGKYQEYRVKPELKLVPFTFEDKDLFKDKWVVNKSTNGFHRITTILKETIVIARTPMSYTELLEKYRFEDGSACGKYVEE